MIDRKVDPGQTVAAQFQTPVMFVVAPDLEKKVYVWASVDEADIGLIREAQKRKQPVTFTVDAYPKDSFSGRISQVRLNPTTVSNVVTYTVIVEAAQRRTQAAARHDGEPGFQIEKRSNVLTVPNAALRFHPSRSRSARAIWRSSKDGRKTMPTSDSRRTRARKGPVAARSAGGSRPTSG